MTRGQKSWRTILIEGSAIVASILLAFWIDASWDGFTARQTEIESLAALRDDFSATLVELRRARGVHQARLDAIEALLLVSPSTPGAAPDSMRAGLDQLLTTTTIDPPTATLEGLVSTGGLSLVTDRQLRTDLAGWAGLLTDHRGTQSLLLREITEEVAPWLRSQVLVERGERRSSRFAPDFDRLLRDFRFDGYLIAIGHRTGIVVSELDRLIERAERIERMLDQEQPE